MDKIEFKELKCVYFGFSVGNICTTYISEKTKDTVTLQNLPYPYGSPSSSWPSMVSLNDDINLFFKEKVIT